MSNEKRYNICTLAETPRVPEHCIEYVYIKEWNEQMKRKLNTDSKEDMMWIYERALKRAEIYGIQGVTYMLTMGVLKHIIPAVATTNAIVAASCVNETLKFGTSLAVVLDNQMQYSGQTGTNVYTFQYERSDNCIVCKNRPIDMTLKEDSKLSDLVCVLKQAPYNLKNPSLRSNSVSLYMAAPKSLEEELRPRLDMTWK
jgi:ubiquitin-activating enzyme E1 C